MKKILGCAAAVLLAFTIASHAQADLTSYSQDFEGLDMASPTALGDDGWLVFANVFGIDGTTFQYNYGPFAAPNGTPGFSSIATGSGGPNQGDQYLNVYNDYNNGDHANGFFIEANVFQEQTIGAADLGNKYNFNFDFRSADDPFGPADSATAAAFIKILDPNNGFSLVAFPRVYTTFATLDWKENANISITIDDSWEGHILQFGFVNKATNFDPTGVYYDNITFGKQVIPEPTSVTVLSLGLAGLLLRRRR